MAIIGINSIQLNATDNYKTLEVKIVEGAIDNSNLSKRINIPNLKDVRVKSVSNGGTAKLEVTDTQVNILVSGGNPSRKVNNPSKRTEQMREARTNSNNSFSNTIQVSSGGINVTLSKDGTSKVISGTYTPSESKEVAGQTSANYSNGGFSGNLERYVSSGSLTPKDSKFVDNQTSSNYDTDGYRGTLEGYVISGEYIPQEGRWERQDKSNYRGDTLPYNSGGYVGVLTGERVCDYEDRCSWTYSGYVVRPPSDTRVYRFKGNVVRPELDTRVYHYKGTVTKPESDTRVWEQQYSGTKHIPGIDNYYSCTVVLEYIDNTKPTLSITTSTEPTYVNEESTVTVEGIATDPDQQQIKIQGMISEVNKETVLKGPINKGGWAISWTGEELKEGTYKDIPFTVTDGDEESVEVFKGSIVVDKTKPTMTITVE